MSYEPKILKKLIEEGDKQIISAYMEEHDLILDGRKIRPQDIKLFKRQAEFWEQRQYSVKILLNSLYGALLNTGMRFFDDRLGQSTTLTGRTIVQHMNAKTNEIITNKYDYRGEALVYADTDSVASESIIRTNIGNISIERLFHACAIKYIKAEKEYAADSDILVIGFDPSSNIAKLEPINYVYRHKVRKKKFRITDSKGHSIIVTEDHSIMVERNNKIIEIKPKDINIGDILIVI